MKLSIVIPVYNEAAALSRCLSALAAQTVPPDEVLVVDNNSTDGSRLVAERFPFVRLLHEPKQGIVHARDRGFNAARGGLIARIDADTVVPEDWVAHIRDFYRHPLRAVFAYSGGARFYNVRLPRAVSWLYSWLAFDFNRLLIGHSTLWGSNMAITRQQWRAVRGSVCRQTGQHEDLDLAMHLHEAGYQIYYDRSLQVGAQLRRVRSNRQELWAYLQWWPRTLRQHGKKSWAICWLIGCLMLYLITPLLNVSEYLARAAGFKPLRELSGAERI